MDAVKAGTSPGRVRGEAAVVAPSAPDLRNLETVLNDWKRSHAEKSGYRWDKAVGPTGQIDRVEVSSWLQVPEILAKLEVGRQSGNPCDVRLTFPRPADGTDPIEAKAIITAQKEISAFFKENHSKSAADVRGALVEKLGGVAIPGNLTADQWLDATVTFDKNTPSSLSVTELIKIEKMKGEAPKTNELQATLNSALEQKTKHNIAFVVPGAGEAVFSEEAQQLAKTLQTTKMAGVSETDRARKEALARVSVWVEAADAKPPTVFKVDEFIEKAGKGSSGAVTPSEPPSSPAAAPGSFTAASSAPTIPPVAAAGEVTTAQREETPPPASPPPAPPVTPPPSSAPALAAAEESVPDITLRVAPPASTGTGPTAFAEGSAAAVPEADKGDRHLPGNSRRGVNLSPAAFAEFKRLWREKKDDVAEVTTPLPAQAAEMDNQGLAEVRYTEDGSSAFIKFTQKGKIFAERVCGDRSPRRDGRLDEDAIAELDHIASKLQEPLSRGREPFPVVAKDPEGARKLAIRGLVDLHVPDGRDAGEKMTLTRKGIEVVKNLPPANAYTPHLHGRNGVVATSSGRSAAHKGASQGSDAGTPTEAPPSPVVPAPSRQPVAGATPAPKPAPTPGRGGPRKPGKMTASLDTAGEVLRLGQNAEQNGWQTPLAVDNQKGASELAAKELVRLSTATDGKQMMTLTEKGARHLDVWKEVAAS